MMSTTKTLAFALLLGTSVIGYAQSDAQTKPPDNTANNRGNSPTADNQKMNPADRQMTAQIRKSIMNDKSLSTYAHNIKIIAQNGVITLKGPVRSDEEIRAIVAHANDVAGSPDKVVNQLEVKPKTTNK